MDLPVDGWHGRAVVVTGADGFIGSHLVDELLRRGSRVTAVVRRTSRSQVDLRFRNLGPDTVARLDKVVHLDLAGPGAAEVLAELRAEVWFHLAADAYVPASLTQPEAVFHANTAATMNVLVAARRARPDHVLATSSSEIYGSHGGPIAESSAFRPATPYAASKVACDRLAWSFHNTFDVPVTIVRPFNCFGPRHVYDVVPKFLAAALRADDLVVAGDGEQSRDLTYVADTVEGFLRLGELEPGGEAYNIGTGVDHTVLAIARAVVDLTNTTSAVRHGPPRPGEVRKLQADATKLRAATGWRPTWDLRRGLRANLEWFLRAGGAG